MKNAIAIVLLLTSSSAFADEYTFCLLFNRVAAAGKLSEYTDRQVENALCMTAKEAIDAIGKGDKLKQRICLEASDYAMREFLRRFGNRDPKTVIGKC